LSGPFLKRALAAALLLTLTTPFWDLGRPLWEIDDARYAEIPREMAESGDWLTPRLNYLEYVEKPPLIYWAGALSYLAFGVGEAAGRLPNALFSLFGLIGVFWLGTRLFSRRTGLAAALILGTSVQFFTFGHYVTPDMAVTVSLLWATGLILLALRDPEHGARPGALAWVAMSAGFFSKGLIALVLPGLWTAVLLLLFPQLRRGLRPLLLNWGPLFLLATVGTWLFAMEARNPGFLGFFFLEQHFKRFLTSHFNRPGSWHYFIPVVIVGGLPWTPLSLPAVLTPLGSPRETDPRELQLALWAALVFVFFSLSESKLISYILPIFPHQALLTARLLERLHETPRLRKWLRAGGTFAAGILLAAAAAAPAVVPRLSIPISIGSAPLAIASALLAALGTALLVLTRGGVDEGDGSGRLALTALCGLIVCGSMTAGVRHFTSHLSVKRISLAAKARIETLEPEAEVRLMSYDFLPHGLMFYAQRPVDMLNWYGELKYAKRFEKNAHRFESIENVWRLPSERRRVLIVFPRKETASFSRWVPEDQVRRLTQFERWVLAEL